MHTRTATVCAGVIINLPGVIFCAIAWSVVVTLLAIFVTTTITIAGAVRHVANVLS